MAFSVSRSKKWILARSGRRFAVSPDVEGEPGRELCATSWLFCVLTQRWISDPRGSMTSTFVGMLLVLSGASEYTRSSGRIPKMASLPA